MFKNSRLKISFIIFPLLIFLGFIHSQVSLAQTTLPQIPQVPITGTQSIVNIFNNTLTFMFQIFGIIAVMVILYSAALFMFSGDNEKTREKAKGYLKWGVVGIIVAIISGSIITLVNNFLLGI